MMTTTERILAGIILSSTVWMAGCSDRVVEPTRSGDVDLALLLSDTSSSASVTASSAPGPGGLPLRPLGTAQSPEASANVAYISLPPGTAPNGVTAIIRHQRTGIVITAPLLGGGFDPVAVPAIPGDVVEVSVRAADGATVLHYIRAVPSKRPPKVVRTSPPPGKRDVALNTMIVIVFSEPIDEGTLSDTTVRLLRDGLAVAGTVALLDAAHLSVGFSPAAPLAGSTEYQLVVTQDVRDLDGEAVEAPVTVGFATVSNGETPLSGRIVFSNFVSISVINAEGADLTTLVDGGRGWQYGSPTWSPDGARIAFASNRDGGWHLHVVEADGLWLTSLRGVGELDEQPAWSPDGAHIAFASTRDGGSDIYVMSTDGSELIRLTNLSGDERSPGWSPDGNRMVFAGDTGLYVINANGTGLALIMGTTGATSPDWSPDGRTIVFARGGMLHVANADGSGLRPLGVAGEDPAWSPDGTRIVFSNWNLFVIKADGSGLRDLNVYGQDPAWSAVDPP